MDIPLQTVVIALCGIVYTILMTLIGYLLLRTIRQYDKKSDNHEDKIAIHGNDINTMKSTVNHHQAILDKHSNIITTLLSKMTILETTAIEQNRNIMDKLNNITDKLDRYDENIKEFYQKYELPLKK